jgi:16S rRNA U516 pseudouridylate synthase RsuA-like enzyme
MCAAVGHDVLALARVRIGDYTIGSLACGAWVRLDPAETRKLLRPPTKGGRQ